MCTMLNLRIIFLLASSQGFPKRGRRSSFTLTLIVLSKNTLYSQCNVASERNKMSPKDLIKIEIRGVSLATSRK
ncbi:hypothetical protein DM01DRAFT_1158179 [Hesseltinella vesiculosa]|uniref:Uncharacterized protein n=1 Tax=Hesseltinella vesiculosa TaxID=101127 RepID=A0A1X2GS85_9FUNG|nr:hypothetical protein DM01DRAFT_1158179 [Hesseltinella vesiculosa]